MMQRVRRMCPTTVNRVFFTQGFTHVRQLSLSVLTRQEGARGQVGTCVPTFRTQGGLVLTALKHL